MAPVSVVVAGGIPDGWGLAAVLIPGVYRVLIGTRFYASGEALCQGRVKQQIVATRSEKAARARMFDTVRGYVWPPAYTGCASQPL